MWFTRKEKLAALIQCYWNTLHTILCIYNCVYMLAALADWMVWLLTHTRGTALAVVKCGAGAGHWGAGNLVTHNLRLLPSLNIRDISGSLISKVNLYIFPYTWHYLASTFGAAVHNPVFLIVKQAAILPAHVFLFGILHPPKGLLHDCVLLCLNI